MEDDGEPDADGDVEMETTTSHDQDMDEDLPPPPSLPHGRRTVGIVADSPSPAATGAADVGVAGTSDALDVDLDAHIIIETNAADDDVADGIVALDQNVNDDLAMGAPPGAPSAIDTTPGMPPPPPGMPMSSAGEPSSSRMPPEVLAQKSHK